MEYDDNINELVARNICLARTKKGLTQKDVAPLVNLSVSQYGLYERGLASITVKFLSELAKILGVEIIAFFDQSTTKEKALNNALRDYINEVTLLSKEAK